MTQQPPRRLLDDASTDARLRTDLTHARAHGTTYDVQGGMRALSATLDRLQSGHLIESAERPTQGAASSGLAAIRAKWWGWAAAGVATVGAVWWVQQDRPVQPEQRAAPYRAAAHARTTVAQPLPEPVAPGRPSTAASEVATSSAQRARLPSPAARAPAARASSAAPRASVGLAESQGVATPARVAPGLAREVAPAHEHASGQTSAASAPNTVDSHSDLAEVEHLARLRRLLASQPQRALEAARDGQRRFAHGLFVEERAGLIVFALARLGNNDDALREGRQFLREHPAGPFAARVREIVAGLEREHP